jgi:hypothetical protein
VNLSMNLPASGKHFVSKLMLLFCSHQCELEEEQESVRQADIVKQIEMEIQVTAQRFRNYPCPSCGQENPKVKLLHAFSYHMILDVIEYQVGKETSHLILGTLIM